MGSDVAAQLGLVVVGVVALLGVYLLVTSSTRSAELAARADLDAEDAMGQRALEVLDRGLRRSRAGQGLAAWLDGAGVGWTALELVLRVALGAVALSVVGYFLASPVVAVVVGVAVSVLAARAYVSHKRDERRDLFVAQLPEVARILSNGTQAGLSMAGAVQLAARELEDPAGAELTRVLEEMRVGRALDEALEGLRERLPSREVGVLMTTLVIQQRAGGDTVRALQELGSTLEARKDLLREIKTLLSGAVFTSYVVVGIAVATVVIVNVINPGVLREMTSTGGGIAAIAVAGVLWGIAAFFIRQTTRVEV